MWDWWGVGGGRRLSGVSLSCILRYSIVVMSFVVVVSFVFCWVSSLLLAFTFLFSVLLFLSSVLFFLFHSALN